MDTTAAVYKNAWPYQKDKMALPVRSVDTALPFYETNMKFVVTDRKSEPINSAVLSRDGIQIGLAENGGDPEQDGCFFEVDNVENALMELKQAGLNKEVSELKLQKHGDTTWRVFFVVAPDGLCYCMGERQA